MSMLARIEKLTSIAINIPGDVEKISVIVEQKAQTAEAALKREAAALEKAVTPEVEAALEKLEDLLAHIPGLSALVAAHSAVETAGEALVAALSTPATVVMSDAIPTAPIL